MHKDIALPETLYCNQLYVVLIWDMKRRWNGGGSFIFLTGKTHNCDHVTLLICAVCKFRSGCTTHNAENHHDLEINKYPGNTRVVITFQSTILLLTAAATSSSSSTKHSAFYDRW